MEIDRIALESIARSLGKASRAGGGWVCLCPAHDDRYNPSLSLSLGEKGKLLAYCYTGCSFHEVISSLKERGLLKKSDSSSPYYQGFEPESHKLKNDNLRSQSLQQKAKQLWCMTCSPQGTPVETYLKSRLGDNFKDIPAPLRFIPNLKHTPSGGYYPSMVAAVSHYPNKEVTAVHRTYLSCEGNSKAILETPKMLLGNSKGGAIHLTPVQDELIVCEGIEEGLTLLSLFNKAVWVAGSASLLGSLILPPLPLASLVYIAEDKDLAGKKNAALLKSRLNEEGRRVLTLKSPEPYEDFNHLLQSRHNEKDKN